MRVTSHTDLLPEHTPGGACSRGEHHSHAAVQIPLTLAGLVFTGTINLTGVLDIRITRAGRTPLSAACGI